MSDNQLNNLQNCVSTDFKDIIEKLHASTHSAEREYGSENCDITHFQHESVNVLETVYSVNKQLSVKWTLQSLTPSKSGCTPKAKRLNKHATPKKNRKRLIFLQTPAGTPSTSTSKTRSPGPTVTVQIGYRNSKMNSTLKGHDKLACRAIVIKQYKTALNHLLQIDDIRKDIANVARKTINDEARKMCCLKNSLIRSSHISNFSWKGAYKQLETTCQVITDILKTVICKNDKQLSTPRLVTSIGVILFSRNRQMNTLQTINSVLMFCGHVRSRVYSTFNRAGLCNSYKATLNTADKICEVFDVPVKRWSEQMSKIMTSSQATADHISDDHCYVSDFKGEMETTCSDHQQNDSSPALYTAEPMTEFIADNKDSYAVLPIPSSPLESSERNDIEMDDTVLSPMMESEEELTPKTPVMPTH